MVDQKRTAVFSAAAETTQPSQAEARQAKQLLYSSELSDNMPVSEMQTMLHKLHIHQLELEMQNDELRRIQRELDAARAHYIDLYDLVPVGYCTLNTAGVILQLNLTACQMLGMTREQLVQQVFSLFINQEDRDIFYLLNRRLGAIGEVHKCELRMLKQAGMQCWVSLVVTTVSGANGAVELRIVLVDISERKKIHDQLHVSNVELNHANMTLEASNAQLIKSSAQLTAFIRNAPVCLAMFDRHMNYLVTSDSWVREYGCGLDNLVGFNHYQLTPDMPDYWKRLHQQALAGTTLKNCEDKWVRADGSILWLHWQLQPWLDERSAIGGIIIYAENINERKAYESQLLENEQRLHGFFNSAMDAIITVDSDYRIVLFNPAAASMFSVPASDALGTSLDMFIPLRFRADHRQYIEEFGKGEQASSARRQFNFVVGVRANGEEFPIEATISHIEMQGKRLYTVIIRDRTHNKKVEAELQLYQEQLRGLITHQQHIKEEERIRIAREIHDELGSVLTGVKANLSVAMHENEMAGNSPNRRLMDASVLLNQAVDTARRVITDLRPSVLDQLGIWTAVEWYAEQLHDRTGILCSVDISNEVLETEIDTERSTAIFRILQESLTNVTRHAHAKQVEIRLAFEANRIQMEVEDNGCGIDAKSLANPNSWGIVGMIERVRFFGGSITISNTLQGTLVVLQLPLGQLHGK